MSAAIGNLIVIISQTHFQGFLASLEKISIPIEQRRNHDQIISVSPLRFSKVQILYVNMSQYGELGIGLAGLEN